MQRRICLRLTGRPALARIGAGLLWLLLLTGCPGPQTVRPTLENAPLQRAERAARGGDHAASARSYEEAAAGGDGEPRVTALVKAMRQWLLVPDIAEATRVEALAAAVTGIDPDGAAAVARALAGADVFLAAGQPERALARLRSLGEPPAETAGEVLLARARAQFMLGRALDGVRSLTLREKYLPAAAVADSRRVLWDALRAAAARGANLSVPRGTDPVSAGWLELARVATLGSRNPHAQRGQLLEWMSRYASHPANGALTAGMLSEATPQLQFPSQVALLLPLSGRFADAGEALRDGFMAAYYQQDAAARPRLKIYDASDDPVLVYRRAVADGAGFVIGPLGKENVQAVTHAADGSVPTLALNFLPDGDPLPARFFQFALAPEDEARQVAERLLASGRRVGVALVPAGEWGTRVLAAFQAALTAGGGTLAASRSFQTSTTDFSEPLVAILGFDESQRRFRALTAAVGPLQFTPRRRDDLQFVFLAGQPVHGRLVRSQLKFHYAGDLPVYSISDIYDPNPNANQDLEGVCFTDIPWMIDDDQAVSELRNSVQQLWPANARRRGRLFAMGFDSWRLIGVLKDARVPVSEPVAGMTGRLTVDAAGRVRRGLDWAVVGSDGRARLLPPPEPEL
jgi:outer membrane PBP1 activator LpoA protein